MGLPAQWGGVTERWSRVWRPTRSAPLEEPRTTAENVLYPLKNGARRYPVREEIELRHTGWIPVLLFFVPRRRDDGMFFLRFPRGFEIRVKFHLEIRGAESWSRDPRSGELVWRPLTPTRWSVV